MEMKPHQLEEDVIYSEVGHECLPALEIAMDNFDVDLLNKTRDVLIGTAQMENIRKAIRTRKSVARVAAEVGLTRNGVYDQFGRFGLSRQDFRDATNVKDLLQKSRLARPYQEILAIIRDEPEVDTSSVDEFVQSTEWM